MNQITRLIVVAGVGLGTYALIYWPSVILLSQLFKGQYVFLDTAPKVVSLICAAAAGWVVWRKLQSGLLGLISHMLIGAILFGFIGFSAGFFGPMIFAPDNNLAAITGILYTGPLGFVIGAIAGYFYWLSGLKAKFGRNGSDQGKSKGKSKATAVR